MSTRVLPTLAGLGFSVFREPLWSTNVNEASNGMETAVKYQSYPRWLYELTWNILRSDSTNLEWQNLAGFFNVINGRYDTFLYDDPDDDTVTTQLIGQGDGSTLTFQLVRTFGAGGNTFNEPILAPHLVSAVYVDGVSVSGSFWSVSTWGSATPGIITFAGGHAPANGKNVTADFTYYFPCRFQQDSISFEKFMYQMWNGKSVKFKTVKNGT